MKVTSTMFLHCYIYYIVTLLIEHYYSTNRVQDLLRSLNFIVQALSLLFASALVFHN